MGRTGRARKKGIKPKTLSAQGLVGQRGINLIERILLEMGSRWDPSGANEVGIDGHIELFDPSTRVPLGLKLAVQSKVVSSIRDAVEEFSYSCSSGDLEYWLKGNIPVILIVSDPETSQAYWVLIQEVFKDWKPNHSTTVKLKKSHDQFDINALPALIQAGAPAQGLYLAPKPKRETLWTNLLRVDELPPLIFIGGTSLKWAGEVWNVLNLKGIKPKSGWILWEKKIVSFEDLSGDGWNEICDPGTVEGFETTEYSESKDTERKKLFVQLLNRTLRTQLYSRLRYWPDDDCFAMMGEERKQGYPSLKRASELSVVSSFESTAKDGRVFPWRRHLAFRGQFRYVDDSWYLEITPTYRFTTDGEKRERFHEERLKKIKEIEGNRAVLSCVLFWASFLQPEKGLFAEEPPPIQFGSLQKFVLEVGIEDNQWKRNDPQTAAREEQSDAQGLLPMELPEGDPA